MNADKMVEVSEHLAPRDGVSDARLKFAGLDVAGASAVMRFDVHQGDTPIGTFAFKVAPSGNGVDAMIAVAHQMMNDALRQMLYRNEAARRGYEKRSA